MQTFFPPYLNVFLRAREPTPLPPITWTKLEIDIMIKSSKLLFQVWDAGMSDIKNLVSRCWYRCYIYPKIMATLIWRWNIAKCISAISIMNMLWLTSLLNIAFICVNNADIEIAKNACHNLSLPNQCCPTRQYQISVLLITPILTPWRYIAHARWEGLY